MKILIAGGTGLIGQALARNWLEANYQVTILGRSEAKIHKLYKNKTAILTWNKLEKSTDIVLSHDLIVNLAGCNIGAQRWTEVRKKEILDSRVNTTKKLADICAQAGAKAPSLFNASGIGIYGIQTPLSEGLPPALGEKTPINYDAAPDFLAHVSREWEKATFVAKENGVRVVNMRFGVVLSKEGGALPQLALPIKFFLGGKIGPGQQPISWITLADLIYAIDFVWQLSAIRGPVNFVTPHTVTQNEFVHTLARIFYRPTFVRTPAFFIKLLLGEMGEALILNGQNVKPSRLAEHNFNFSYPELTQALKRIYH
ncbi:MAG: TIGR01777 family oxidoreductase [Pseudomonadota bacterium]